MVCIYLGSEGEPCTRLFRVVPCLTCEKGNFKPSLIEKVKLHTAHSQLLKEMEFCNICDTKTDYELFFEPNIENVNFFPGYVDKREIQVLAVNVTEMSSENVVKVVADQEVGNLAMVVNISECDESLKIFAAYGEEHENDEWNKEKIRSMLDLADDLTRQQKDEVVEMVYSVRGVLSKGDFDMGNASMTPHRIELFDDTPICQKTRRFSEIIAREIEGQCKELLLKDIIEPSISPWNSPIVPVRKKDGSLRMCLDYRRLNRVTIPQKFPIPNLTDTVFSLHGKNFFSCLDMVKSYYQLDLEKDSRPYTAFSTSQGHYQFRKLCFGLVNAPAAFQRGMQEILKEFSRNKVIIYIDDLLMMDSDFDSHLKLMKKVLGTLERAGIKINPMKCQWFKPEVRFLGHVVSSKGLRKAPEYIKKVFEFPRPVTRRQLREFLGIVNFQRKFIPKCSELSAPLSRCTGGNSKDKLKWSEEMEISFTRLKEEIAKEIELAYPDYSEGASKLELSVDASGVGSGPCLTQNQGGDERIIAFASMCFSQAQSRYSTIEKELVGLRWGIKTFRAFLLGTPFILYTDHKPLIFLHNMQMVDNRLARTLEDISEYNFEIRYRPGRLNILADALSRVAGVMDEETVDMENVNALPDGFELIKEVSGGGDSVFESLLILLGEIPMGKSITLPPTKDLLRIQLVDEFLRNIKVYKPTAKARDIRCIQAMKSPGVLPVTEIFLATSQLYCVRIWIHYGMISPLVYVANKKIQDPQFYRIHLQCISGIHYNPIRPKSLTYYKNFDTKEETVRCEEKEKERKVEDEKENVPDFELNLFFDDPEKESEDLVSCGHKERNDSLLKNISWTWMKVDNIRFCALLDTGAAICLATKSVINSLQLQDQIMECRATIIGMGQHAFSLEGYVNLNLNDEEFPFGIVNDGDIPSCLLVGINYLKTREKELDYSKEEIVQSIQDDDMNLEWTLGFTLEEEDSVTEQKIQELGNQVLSVDGLAMW